MRVLIVLTTREEGDPCESRPSAEMADMHAFQDRLMREGILIGGEGLHPISEAVRVKFNGSERTVTDGPFAETKEAIAGYWLWKVKSMDHAVEWLKQAPFADGAELEIRPIFEAEDFWEEFTPELRARKGALRA